MGHTLTKLFRQEISPKSIFNNRFVIEIAEKVHIHYRSLRILLSLQDWIEFCRGCVQALDRWEKRGCPEPKEGVHIELCRKRVGTEAYNEGMQINLNANLYNKHEGQIFAEGADFKDDKYIHLKIRDLRVELSQSEFMVLAKAVDEARGKLENSSSS